MRLPCRNRFAQSRTREQMSMTNAIRLWYDLVSCPNPAPRRSSPATKPPNQNPVQYLIHCLEKEAALEGPVSLEISRIGQEIVDPAPHVSTRSRGKILAASFSD